MADPTDDPDTGSQAQQQTQQQTRRGASPGQPGAATGPASAAASAAAAAAAAPRSAFAGYALASASQHASTHLSHAAPASASLSGEMLRQAWSQYLRSQVAHVSLAIVLEGFQAQTDSTAGGTEGGGSSLTSRGGAPSPAVAASSDAGQAQAQSPGKLCYIALTQCEMVVIDRAVVGALSPSSVAPPYEEILRSSTAGRGQMLLSVPYHALHEIRVDSEREDLFQLHLREDRGPGFPALFVLSTVHRKVFCEQLSALYNAHFLLAAMMPDPSAALSTASQAALLVHAQVAASRHVGPSGLLGGGAAPDVVAPGLGLAGVVPHNQFSVLTSSANHSCSMGQIRKLSIVFDDGVGGAAAIKPYKHPAEQFYRQLPSKYRGKIFHRCGYMFEIKRPTMGAPSSSMASAAASVSASAAAPSESASSSSSSSAGGSSAGAPGFVSQADLGEWVDSCSLFLNRPTSTYRFMCKADAELNVPLAHRKILQVHFCAERSISAYSTLVKSRDLRGQMVGRGLGKGALKELLRGRDDCEDDDFFAWSESVGRAVAMNECRALGAGKPVGASASASAAAAPAAHDASSAAAAAAAAASASSGDGSFDYFVPQSLAHTKKLNAVGDKSSWTAFKIHVYTTRREIGVITLRRKGIPPNFDTFQDMVFVLYGPCAPLGSALRPREGFLEEVESMVDTLSPTVVPLPFHYTQGTLSVKVVHPTYADEFAMQARVNALLHNQASYAWMATRPWLHGHGTHAGGAAGMMHGPHAGMSSRHAHARAIYGIVPTVEFLGTPCFTLARSFANSILVRVTHRRERVVWAEFLPVAVEGIGAEHVDESFAPQPSTTTTVAAAAAAVEGDTAGGAEGGDKASALAAAEASAEDDQAATRQSLVADPMVIVSRMLTEFAAAEALERRKLGPQSSTYSGEEEWRCRVAQYLAYCVDDGIFPGALNMKRLLSVLTRTFLDAPILTSETSMKLDRVVDFLLYLKRRCGPPLELPSFRAAQAAVRGGNRAAAAAAAGATASAARLGQRSGARPVKVATAELAAASSPFASLAAQSPAACFTEGEPGAYDYDESSTLLSKLRDPSLLANFTCNEHVMVHLLDCSYIESLEKATIGTPLQSDTSVVPPLLAALLAKDYNIDLLRACKDKILSYQLSHPCLIAPLIALVKDSTSTATHFALQALAVQARTHRQEVIDAGGASLSLWLIFRSKNELLLSSAINLVITLFTAATKGLFAQPLLARKLVDLLRMRVGQQRYCSAVLEKTCRLMMDLVIHVPELVAVFLGHYVHAELLAIIADYSLYHPILLVVTSCLGNLFACARMRMLQEPSENALQDASTLVRTLAHFTTRTHVHLRIALNMLLTLQTLIRLPRPYYAKLSNTMKNPLKAGGEQYTTPDPAFAMRVSVLQHLHAKVGLENVVDRALASADVEERRCNEFLLSTGTMTVGANGAKVVLATEGDTSDPHSTASRVEETKENRTIAINVKKRAQWFKARMSYAVSAQWNIATIWQRDNAKNFLAPAAEK